MAFPDETLVASGRYVPAQAGEVNPLTEEAWSIHALADETHRIRVQTPVQSTTLWAALTPESYRVTRCHIIRDTWDAVYDFKTDGVDVDYARVVYARDQQPRQQRTIPLAPGYFVYPGGIFGNGFQFARVERQRQKTTVFSPAVHEPSLGFIYEVEYRTFVFKAVRQEVIAVEDKRIAATVYESDNDQGYKEVYWVDAYDVVVQHEETGRGRHKKIVLLDYQRPTGVTS